MYKIVKDDFFVREEKNRTILFVRDSSAQFLLNSTGKVIFKTIIENNDIKGVKNSIYNSFPNTEKKLLSNDVENIYNMLEIYGIVKGENEEKSVECNNNVKALDENEYNLIEDFIEENRRNDVLISGPKGYYVAQNVRAHVMNNQEYYYAYFADNKIKALMVITPNINNTSVVNLTTLVFDKLLTDSEKKTYAIELLNHIRKNMLNPVNKFRVSYYAKNMKDEPAFIKDIKTAGFIYENILKKEYQDMDLYLYEYSVK